MRLFRRPTSETRSFYEKLMKGQAKRTLWGKESRFDPEKIANSPSVKQHFSEVLRRYVNRTHRCLDLGCGSGGFMLALAAQCGHVVGADIIPAFIDEARTLVQRHGIGNAEVVLLNEGKLPFADGEFDRVVMVDTIHHLEDVAAVLAEVKRILTPGGVLLIFEPNKLNPALAALCLLDRNERGLLSLGTFRRYARVLGAEFNVMEQVFNGLLIGPDSPRARRVADFLGSTKALSWLSPKLFIAATKI